MARLARNRFWSTTAPANGLHHVTNRGVDRNPLFVTAVDRLIFLSLLAFFCHDDGLRVHCFCLMTNHFHLLVEDPRGLLSRMMLRLETAYARYLRDTRSRRGHGHIFGDRFFSRRIGSNRDYRTVVAYILRNPIVCKEPLATSPEAYLWSTAAMLVSETTSATFCAELVEGFGGVDAILGRLPSPRTSRLKRARRERFERLVEGAWLDAAAARSGETGELFGNRLRERGAATIGADELTLLSDPLATVASAEDDLPLVEATFRGHAGRTVLEALERFAGNVLARGEIAAYALWRFTSMQAAGIARMLSTSKQRLTTAIEATRRHRTTSAGSNETLSRLEWRLTCQLRGGPCRV